MLSRSLALSIALITLPFCLDPPVQGQGVLNEFLGDNVDDSMGNAMALGDVNADGIPDYIIGMRNAFNGISLTGGVRVYSGSDHSILHTFYGTRAGGAFGFAVDFAGDTDGDGFGDVIVGTPFHQGAGEILNGRAFLYSGQTGALLFEFGGTNFFDNAGFAVCGAGDLDMDGRADILIGSPGSDVGAPDTGRVTVYSGATGAVLYTIDGLSAGDLLGSSLAALGDLDADGFADFAVGVRGTDVNGNGSGSITVYSGQAPTEMYTVDGSVAGQAMGFSLAHAGDVNGDGHLDWIAGCPQDPRGGFQSGSVQVCSGINGSALHEILGQVAFERLGEGVASAGDLDGDGLGDFLIGAPGDATIDVDAGRLTAHAGVDGSALCSTFGVIASDRLGLGVGPAGDFNGDGIPDFLLGVPGDDRAGSNSGAFLLLAGCRAVGAPYCGPASLNSSGLAASIAGQGSQQASDNQLVLIAESLPFDQFGYFLVASLPGLIPLPGGSQGDLCLGGSLGRFNKTSQIRNSGPGGRFQLEVDLTGLPLNPIQPALTGETWHFQAWFRDQNPSNTSNFTEGLAITFL
ncbi:MAG: FG-GAP repeat protein [Planctomycetes bacterium]|nr:FG-GAP repeat protein [Planctomycetota bacterium]